MSNEKTGQDRCTAVDSRAVARTDEFTGRERTELGDRLTETLAPGIADAERRLLRAGWTVLPKYARLVYVHDRYKNTYFMFAAAVRMQDMRDGKI
jgi:hypothetical protein